MYVCVCVCIYVVTIEKGAFLLPSTMVANFFLTYSMCFFSNEGILYIPLKLQHYWSLNIRLFSIIFRTLERESCPSAEMQSVYPIAPADLAMDTHWERESCSSAEIQLVYPSAPADLATGFSLGEGVLPLGRDAVGVSYSRSRLDKVRLEFKLTMV